MTNLEKQMKDHLKAMEKLIPDKSSFKFIKTVSKNLPATVMMAFELQTAEPPIVDFATGFIQGDEYWKEQKLYKSLLKLHPGKKWKTALDLTNIWMIDDETTREKFESIDSIIWEFDFSEKEKDPVPSIHYSIFGLPVDDLIEIIEFICATTGKPKESCTKLIDLINGLDLEKVDLTYLSILLSRSEIPELRLLVTVGWNEILTLEKIPGDLSILGLSEIKFDAELIKNIKDYCEVFVNIAISPEQSNTDFALEIYPQDKSSWLNVLSALKNGNISLKQHLIDQLVIWAGLYEGNSFGTMSANFNTGKKFDKVPLTRNLSHIKFSFSDGEIKNTKFYATLDLAPDKK